MVTELFLGRLVIVLAIALGGIAAAARGDVTTTAPEVGVSVDTSSTFATMPATASRAGFVVTWQQLDTSNGNGWEVYFRQMDAAGVPLATPARANTTVSGCQRAPSVAMDGAGNFLIAWESDSQTIRAQLYAANGSAVGSEMTVNTTVGSPTARKQAPAIAATPVDPASGTPSRFLVVWESEGQDGSGFGIYGQLVSVASSSGVLQPPVAVGGEFLINGTTTGSQHAPRVAFEPNFTTYASYPTRFLVVWQSDGSPTSGVFLRKVDASGSGTPTLDGGELQVDSETGATNRPAIAADAWGNSVVAWERSSVSAGTDIRFVRLRQNVLFGTEQSANALGPQTRQRPTVTAMGSGDFLIAWESASQDGSGDGAYATYLDQRGLPVLLELALATTTAGDQKNAAVSSTAPGLFLVAWQSPVVAPGNVGVRARTLLRSDNFYTLTPCRFLDTRNPTGPLGGPSLQPGAVRSFAVAGICGVPTSAKSLSINVTVTDAAVGGSIVVSPGDANGTGPIPNTSTINFSAGNTRANNAVIHLAADGSGSFNVKLLSSTTADFIIDVNGYFQ